MALVLVSANLAGAGNFGSEALLVKNASIALSGSGVLTGTPVFLITSHLSGRGTVSSDAVLSLAPVVALSGAGSLAGGPTLMLTAEADLAGQGEILDVPLVPQPLATDLAGTSSLVARAIVRKASTGKTVVQAQTTTEIDPLFRQKPPKYIQTHYVLDPKRGNKEEI